MSRACSANVSGMPPAGRTSCGNSTSLCASASWIRRSMSRMASRYWVILSRSDVQVSIESAAELDPRDYTSDTLSGRLYPVLRPRNTSGEFGARNEVALQVVEDGVHQIAVSVVNKITHVSYPIRGTEPTAVDIRTSEGLQILEIHIPEQGLREALERAGRGL